MKIKRTNLHGKNSINGSREQQSTVLSYTCVRLCGHMDGVETAWPYY